MMIIRLGIVSFVNSVFGSSIGCVIVVYCRLVYMCGLNSGVAKKLK